LRLHLIEQLLAQPWFREAYFACGRPLLESLVGNELAMQRGVGLSIQLPGDEGSLLPLHSDVWSEDSPFEVVLWIPLVDCYRSKSMFLLPPEADARWRDRLHEFAAAGTEGFFRAVERELHWLEIPYGNVLLFTHTLMHGNRVNAESTARWSMNLRFKGLFTPYSDKALGDFFEPITLRAASRIGMNYRLPGGFDV
jgi:sporadic carbohydrate cluster 2OG-Fe(II) oxygenase